MIKYFVPDLDVFEIDYCIWDWKVTSEKGTFFNTQDEALVYLSAQRMKILYDLLLKHGGIPKGKHPQDLDVSYYESIIRNMSKERQSHLSPILDTLFEQFKPVEIKKVEIE